MTYSLVAHDPRTGQVGVAAMTAMVGVGKLVSHARSATGAAASQAFLNPYLAVDGLDRLETGAGAVETLDRLIAVDPGSAGRQFALVDTAGGSAAWTGEEPDDWKGHRTGTTSDGGGWACQGNRLAGPQVLDSAIAVFLADPDRPLVERLMAALEAGERAGGDTNGHRSATALVMSSEVYPLWDLRIDHADDPLGDLQRLYHVVDEHLAWQIEKMPTRDDPLGQYDFGDSSGCA